MHPALEKLLRDIEGEVVRNEQWFNRIMLWFPMPPSNFLQGLEYGEAKDAFDKAISAFYYAHFIVEHKLLPASAGRQTQYDAINQAFSAKSSATMIEDYYGNPDLAFKIARNEVEGGISGIIKTMSSKMRIQYLDVNIIGLIREGWGSGIHGTWTEGKTTYSRPAIEHKTPLYGSFEERKAHVQSYKDRFRALLPSEYLNEHIEISVSKFDKVLANHCQLARGATNLL